MKVIARRCPWTQKLFEDDALYSKHLSKLREKHRLNRYWPSMLEQGNQAIQWATQNVTSCTQFEHWMRQNWAALVIRGTCVSDWGNRIKRLDQLPIPELKTVKLQLEYQPCISNSHCSPLDGVQNFKQHPGLARGYPGWTGSLMWSYDHTIKTKVETGSGLFAQSAVHTGPGGSGGNGAYWYSSIILWASDWPAWTVWNSLVSS